MPPTVRFQQLQPWAILPCAHRVDRTPSRERAAVYRDHFRYVRAERRPEHCAPWVMGQELGWRVHSPIDIAFTPLDQVEVDADTNADAAAAAAGRTELWKRERSHLAVNRTGWLHLYQFKTDRGWENMFLPNGAGTVEWRLGWTVEVPRGYFLLVLPSDDPAAPRVPTGVLSSTVTARMSRTVGVSLAVRPTTMTIERGQEVARIILLHADSLQAVTAPEGSDPHDD